MKSNFQKILQQAELYKPQMVRFLRDLIAIPGESCQEEDVIRCIKKEMEAVGFDAVKIDPLGNILGAIGNGPRLLAFDAHIDTVKVGDLALWNYDPYKGFEDDEMIVGRGASDQLGGMAAMVYAGKIIKELNLAGEFTLLFTGTVQEEDCDGLCWRYIIE